MQISARAEEHVPRPPEHVFDFATACETFPKVLLPLGPVAGIAHADLLDGAPLRTGARRRIVLTDGSIIDEQILAFERPRRHRYRWLNPPPAPRPRRAGRPKSKSKASRAGINCSSTASRFTSRAPAWSSAIRKSWRRTGATPSAPGARRMAVRVASRFWIAPTKTDCM